MKKKIIIKEIKKNFSQILGESTGYGIPKIFKSNRKFFILYWLAFLLFASIASIFFINQAVINYLKYEVISKIEIINQNPLPFPTITICPSSQKIFNESLLVDCKFNNNNDCWINSKKYFYKFYSPSYQNYCLQFNSGKNMSGHSVPFLDSTFEDWKFGLDLNFSNASIDIYINDHASIPFINGLHFKLADYSIDLNMHFPIILTKYVENKLGLPYNQCYIDVINEFLLNKEIVNFFRSKNAGYNQNSCFRLCGDFFFIKTNPCNCTNISMGNVMKDCTENLNLNHNIRKCSGSYIKEFSKNSAENCQDYCPLECNTITYSTQVRNSKPIENNLDQSSFRLYYAELKYTKYSEIPKAEAFDLISNIGGILGLFIGCSFVSFFEIAELFIELGFILFKNRKQKRIINDAKPVEETIKQLKNEMIRINSKIELISQSISS